MTKDDEAMSEVTKRYQTDDAFREVANLLFGDGDEIVSKMNPAPSDVAVKAAQKKKDSSEKTQAKIGLASNVIGLAAGAAGTRDAYKGYKASKLPGGVEPPKRKIKYENGKLTRIKPGKLARAGANFKPSTKMLAGGALALQVTNVAGDAVANRVLARAAKKDDKVKKSIKEIEENASFPSKGKLTRATITSAANAHGKGAMKVDKGKFKKLPNKVQTKHVRKSADLDVVWEGEISKVNAEKRQVFGWASVVEMNGEPVVDLQGDYITIDEVEKSAYEYVHKSRKGGDMHLRNEDGQPKLGSHMIESFVVTEEKKKALGLPDSAPTGWWVGYQVNDEELWNKVKSNERTGFSIHGRGVRS